MLKVLTCQGSSLLPTAPPPSPRGHLLARREDHFGFAGEVLLAVAGEHPRAEAIGGLKSMHTATHLVARAYCNLIIWGDAERARATVRPTTRIRHRRRIRVSRIDHDPRAMFGNYG